MGAGLSVRGFQQCSAVDHGVPFCRGVLRGPCPVLPYVWAVVRMRGSSTSMYSWVLVLAGSEARVVDVDMFLLLSLLPDQVVEVLGAWSAEDQRVGATT